MDAESQYDDPGYITLFQSGELAERVQKLESRLAVCDICPRNCGVNRLEGETGFCNSAYLPLVSNVLAHHGEEPVLSGTRGSGTIFFGNCNLRCVYCQNYQISQSPESQRENELTIDELAGKMLYIQNDLRCHNINLVSPTHFVPQIVKALMKAIPQGLHLPIVYNTGGYDSLETIKLLDGIVSIYLPDLKYADDAIGRKYSLAPDYVRHSRAAIREMYHQVGNLTTDWDDIAIRGLLVRHLVLPDGLAGSAASLKWLADELSPSVAVGVMCQYHPIEQVRSFPELDRPISPQEYTQVVTIAKQLGFENGWFQEMEAKDTYVPDFDRKQNPFNR